MSSPLPGGTDLIKATYTDVTTQQKSLWKLNLTAVLGSLVGGILFSVVIGIGFGLVFAGMTATGGSGMGAIVSGVVVGLAGLAAMVVLINWYSAHYTLRVFGLLKKNEEPVAAGTSWKKVPGLIWVTVLQMLATMVVPAILLASTIGSALYRLFATVSYEELEPLSWVNFGALGFLSIIVSLVFSVYFGIRLGFAKMLFLDHGTRGVAALRASWELTKNRFWAVVGRSLLFTVILLLAIGIVMTVLAALGNGGAASLLRTLVTLGLQGFVILPAAMFFQARLYRAFETK